MIILLNPASTAARNPLRSTVASATNIEAAPKGKALA